MHLWWGKRGGESLDSLSGWLSDEERRRSERFRRERDALAFAFRRAFLRSILAERCGCRPEELVFTIGEFGKPALARPVTGLRFSASSSGAWVLVALATGLELGADVEGRTVEGSTGEGNTAGDLGDEEELSRLARRVLTESERTALERLAPAARARAFLRVWTRKEALLKWLGTGLSVAPDGVEVGLEPLQRPREVVPPAPFTGRARMLDLAAPPGFAASLVVELAPDALAARPLRLHPHRPGSFSTAG